MTTCLAGPRRSRRGPGHLPWGHGDRAHGARAARPPCAGRGRRLGRPDHAGDGARRARGRGRGSPRSSRACSTGSTPRSSPSRCSIPMPASRRSPRRACGASGGPVLDIEGEAAALLSAERTALNLLQRLSGVATLTARYVEAVRGTRARVLDTRKTTPGLRAAREGGGGRGRRDQPPRRASSTRSSSRRTTPRWPAAWGRPCAWRARRRRTCALEVECRNDEEVDEALAAGAPRLLLDNMTPAQMRRDRGPRRRSRRARGQRRDRPGDDQGRRRDRGRLHIGRCPHALGPRPRPLTSPGARAMNLPMAPLATPPDLAPEDVARAAGRGPRARARARRGHPRPQLPAPRGAGRRRLRRRLARPLAPGRGDRRHARSPSAACTSWPRRRRSSRPTRPS